MVADDSIINREEGFEAEIRRLLDICIEKASKPITANLDKPAHDKEMQVKSGCRCYPRI